MAGMRLQAEETDLSHQQTRASATAAGDLVSDDDRSVAADSWSIKSDYGSTLDDEQRHVDAAEALSSANFHAASDYNSDKDDQEPDGDGTSMLGLQSYWDAAYADELTNFREHGHAGEIWFGSDVMDTVVSWTKSLCTKISQGQSSNEANDSNSKSVDQGDKYLSRWSVLDIGTGNGLLLQELAKQGFMDLTGVDYSEGAIDLARSLANRNGFPNINFLVDDVLETKLERQFTLIMDKGTLDAIGLHPDGHIKRIMYWDSVSKLVPSGGILIITSCNNTKDELVREAENFSRRANMLQGSEAPKDQPSGDRPVFEYLDHVQTYPTFMFGGAVGSRVATVAFLRR